MASPSTFLPPPIAPTPSRGNNSSANANRHTTLHLIFTGLQLGSIVVLALSLLSPVPFGLHWSVLRVDIVSSSSLPTSTNTTATASLIPFASWNGTNASSAGAGSSNATDGSKELPPSSATASAPASVSLVGEGKSKDAPTPSATASSSSNLTTASAVGQVGQGPTLHRRRWRRREATPFGRPPVVGQRREEGSRGVDP